MTTGLHTRVVGEEGEGRVSDASVAVLVQRCGSTPDLGWIDIAAWAEELKWNERQRSREHCSAV